MIYLLATKTDTEIKEVSYVTASDFHSPLVSSNMATPGSL
jgi:hypothetical protein